MAAQPVKLCVLLDDIDHNPASPPSALTSSNSKAPRSAVMVKLSQAFLEALRSLSRSTSALRQLLKSWLLRIQASTSTPSTTCNPSSTASSAPTLVTNAKSISEFSVEISDLFLGTTISSADLLLLSTGLLAQFTNALSSDPQCMLPSYNHQLPHGRESGRFLALDVGGSTFRVALVELRSPEETDPGMRILSLEAYRITNAIKTLEGVLFFDWMAERIQETLNERSDTEDVLSMGLSWSFPIEQTSLRSGLIQGMGKGFLAAQGLVGQDLGDVIQQVCERRNIKVELKAIVNDSTATLLTKAYTDPTTRFGLILGTGVNAAVHLPVSAFGTTKFGERPASWHEVATHVLVNTECSMFGRGILPLTRWDVQLDAAHMRPGFQPFEHLVSGRYLGEIARLVLVEGVQTAGIFGGVLPKTLEEAYTLETELLANIQTSSSLEKAAALFSEHHPTSTPVTEADIRILQQIAENISSRASAVLAASIHALWQLRVQTEAQYQGHKEDVVHEKNMIACNGSVVQNYPGFRANCQKHLDTLVQMSGGERGSLELTIAVESSLLGAAVAVACIDSE